MSQSQSAHSPEVAPRVIELLRGRGMTVQQASKWARETLEHEFSRSQTMRQDMLVAALMNDEDLEKVDRHAFNPPAGSHDELVRPATVHVAPALQRPAAANEEERELRTLEATAKDEIAKIHGDNTSQTRKEDYGFAA